MRGKNGHAALSGRNDCLKDISVDSNWVINLRPVQGVFVRPGQLIPFAATLIFGVISAIYLVVRGYSVLAFFMLVCALAITIGAAILDAHLRSNVKYILTKEGIEIQSISPNERLSFINRSDLKNCRLGWNANIASIVLKPSKLSNLQITPSWGFIVPTLEAGARLELIPNAKAIVKFLTNLGHAEDGDTSTLIELGAPLA